MSRGYGETPASPDALTSGAGTDSGPGTDSVSGLGTSSSAGSATGSSAGSGTDSDLTEGVAGCWDDALGGMGPPRGAPIGVGRSVTGDTARSLSGRASGAGAAAVPTGTVGAGGFFSGAFVAPGWVSLAAEGLPPACRALLQQQ